MKVAVLFSGGKDSNFALYKASKKNDVVCLISMISENKESYMFQTPGLSFTKLQAKSLDIPIIEYNTKGEKEKELIDLKAAIQKAKNDYNIEGIVTGAINSAYQSSRIQKICNELDLWCYNPLWQKDQVDFLYELVESDFKIVILGVFSYPFDSSYLGKIIDKDLIEKLIEMQNRYQINPAGEGGELETFVLDQPLFKQKLEITESEKIMDSENSGILQIKKIEMIEK